MGWIIGQVETFAGKIYDQMQKKTLRMEVSLPKPSSTNYQKGLKMYEKRQKIEFLDLKNGNGTSLRSKKLSGKGGTPPPLTDKIR